jgi:hypothetical protein
VSHVDRVICIGQWERVVSVFFVDDNHGSRIDEELFSCDFFTGRVEVAMRLIIFRCYEVTVPQVSRLHSNVDEEYRIVGFEDFKTFGSGDLLDLRKLIRLSSKLFSDMFRASINGINTALTGGPDILITKCIISSLTLSPL